MRGLDSTAFLVHMLVSIVISIGPFMLVLGVVLAAFASAVYLMLRHDIFDIKSAASASGLGNPITGSPDESLFNTYGISVFGIIGMMFGEVDMHYFRNSPANGIVAMFDFVLFMMIVPLVMVRPARPPALPVPSRCPLV